MSHTLIASVAGPRFRSCFEIMCRWSCIPEIPPTTVWVGNDEVDERELPDWRARLLSTPKRSLALWKDAEWNALQSLSISPSSEITTFTCPGAFADLRQAVALLEPLPFELCTLGSIYFDQWLAASYPDWDFGRLHVRLGWGCAFRGAGHDRLVSRRWLDFGPWRVIRRPDDTTFIQFHDLAITDPAEAYEQAKSGHERMGISPSGGYIAWHYENLLTGAAEVSGLYESATRTLEIVVGPGNQVSQGQMICQCARRLQHRLTKPANDRIDHVAYVFMDRGDAEAHLHELWLRELQCWYVDERGKHRLDDDYHPTPRPPAWVASLKANPINDV